MARWLAVGLVLAGCYTRKRIVVPPTEHGQFCVKDANMSWQLCVMQQRGRVWCDQRLDRELLSCEGAYEDKLAFGDAGPVEPTYELPGIYR